MLHSKICANFLLLTWSMSSRCMEGRETMRRTGSPLQGEDLGGRRKTDGEGQNDEESNPLASSTAAPSSTVEIAEVIMRVIKETEERERGRNPQ